MRAVRICACGAGKSRAALLQKRTASHFKTLKQFCLHISYLTMLGRVGWENIWLAVIAHGPP